MFIVYIVKKITDFRTFTAGNTLMSHLKSIRSRESVSNTKGALRVQNQATWTWSPSKAFDRCNPSILNISALIAVTVAKILIREREVKRHWGRWGHTYSIGTVYLWSLTSEPILSIVCLISLNLIIFTSTSIPGVYG